MLRLVLLLFGSFRAALHSRADLVIEPGSPAAARRPSPHRSAWPRDWCRSAVLGDVAKAVGEMVRRARLRETRDSDPMAPSRLPQVLDLALATSAHRSAFDQLWSTRIDPALGW